MIQGRPDKRLRAVVYDCRELLYSAPPDRSEDQAAHVRAGSALAWLGAKLVVVQDDANWMALIDPAGGHVQALPLPRGHGGRRLFDEHSGNKAFKLDLEACIRGSDDFGEWLLAFGSGSTPYRERVVELGSRADRWHALIHPAPGLYRAFRSDRAFSGSELNIEGAALLPGGRVRFFQRGNGAPRNGWLPVDATADICLADLWHCLRVPDWQPHLDNVRQYDLGQIVGVRLTFTDATFHADTIFFLAAAEASPDTYHDGLVVGGALGYFTAKGVPVWTVLQRQDGTTFTQKAEGLVFDPHNRRLGYLVTDRDDPTLPSCLCRILLDGPWPIA